MPPEGLDAAARTADVAQQQLQDGRGPDELGSDGVLGPTYGVDERRRALSPRVFGEQAADPGEEILRYPTGGVDHLGGIPRIVTLQHLKYAPGVLKRRVAAELTPQGRAP